MDTCSTFKACIDTCLCIIDGYSSTCLSYSGDQHTGVVPMTNGIWANQIPVSL